MKVAAVKNYSDSSTLALGIPQKGFLSSSFRIFQAGDKPFEIS